MIRSVYLLLWLVSLGCSPRSGDEAPQSSPPLAAVVIGAVYAIPSYMPDDPYWSIRKVLVETNGDVWFMRYTNQIAATPKYSAPPIGDAR
jgi:hypothetical protein